MHGGEYYVNIVLFTILSQSHARSYIMHYAYVHAFLLVLAFAWLQQLAAVARRNGSCPPMEPLAAVPNGGKPTQHPAGGAGQAPAAEAAVPARKLSLGMALKDWHIARRFFILAYAWMVLCMVYYGEPACRRMIAT